MNNDKHPAIELTEEEARRQMAGRTRRGFLVGSLGAAGAVSFYRWVTHAKDVDQSNLPWPQRRVLRTNEQLAEAYLSDGHRMPEYRADQIGGIKPNGDYGLSETASADDWSVKVELEGKKFRRSVSLEQIKKMPRTEQTTRFCCIEGWSGVAHWTGVRFSDFTRQVLPAGTVPPPYVYMATADEEYYVGLDRKSAMHSQTLLAYEQNGKPLELRRGAPLRLAIPVKYGIKNIKQVAVIRYTAQRPGDYWAEEGYDWFARL